MSWPIPKIIHQFWLGDQSKRPQAFLDSWRTKHPDWEYILWTEDEIARRGLVLSCEQQYRDMPEINGKADIVRWEVLYQIGGVAMDADSFCLEAMEPEIFLSSPAGWSGYENEVVRRGLVACGAMGFPPKSVLVGDILTHIRTLDLRPSVTRLRAWVTVAVGLLTEMLKSGRYPDFVVFPSHMFLPHHFTGKKYQGHQKVYAYQEWGSTKMNYAEIAARGGVMVPPEFFPPPLSEKEPASWVSVLIPNFNTPREYLRECFTSIMEQRGHFGIQVVLVDDGSAPERRNEASEELDILQKSSRFLQTTFVPLPANVGVAAALNAGIAHCRHMYIARMDADDIMAPDRLEKQLSFLKARHHVALCGAQVSMFSEDPSGRRRMTATTRHPVSLSFDEWRAKPLPWFMNHPTLMWRADALRTLDGYNPHISFFEDFEIELRAMQRFGPIYNLQEPLVQYRLHPGQVTHSLEKNRTATEEKEKLIASFF